MITEMFRALHAGHELRNKEGWKNAQVTANHIAVILAAVASALAMAGINLNIHQDSLVLIAGGIAGVLGIVNSYLTVATTKSIGMPPEAGDSDDPDKGVMG